MEYELGKRVFINENIFICDNTEAELTEMKKQLVQKKTLASRIDELGIADSLLMGKGDVQQNAVEVMLAPETFLDDETEDYVSLIQEWSYKRANGIPLFHFEERGYSIWVPFEGISQQPKSLDDKEIYNVKYHCYLKMAEDLPVFRGYGHNQGEARKNVCKVAYEYLCKENLWLSIRDEIDNPNKDDAINQLEILARRGYFSIPTYTFEEGHDKNGNPVWKSTCCITEEIKSFSAKSSSKKDAKKSAACKMLQYVLND